MRRLLTENFLKFVAMAAAINVFYVLLRDFGIEYLAQRAATIAYAQKLAFIVSLVDLAATGFFWLAFGALAVRLEDIFREMRRQTGRLSE